jgi:4-carboxymuconolactone decarboxylase
MQRLIPLLTVLSTMAYADTDRSQTRPDPKPSEDVRIITPALYDYTTNVLFGDNWKRAELAARDRSLVTLSSLVAGGRVAQMTSHLKLALDNGVKPRELTGLITHLAFYSGWPKAMSAVGVLKDVLEERDIDVTKLDPPGVPLELDEQSEASRRARVDEVLGGIAPQLADYTNNVLFQEVWRQTDLSPRDRSLVTIAALITEGHTAQLKFHLNRALDNGLTVVEAGEVITHLAFYTGWPSAMSAVPVAREVFEARGS